MCWDILILFLRKGNILLRIGLVALFLFKLILNLSRRIGLLFGITHSTF